MPAGRSGWRLLLHRLLLLLNMLCVLPGLLALLAPFVPSTSWFVPSVLALFAPYLLLPALLWALLWASSRRWIWLLANIGILALGWPQLRASLQLNGQGAANRYDIRVISLNVNAFGYRHKNFEQLRTFLAKYRRLRPDYFQRLKKTLGLKYHEFIELYPGKRFGLLFLSRYPITDAGAVTEINPKTKNGIAYADLSLYGQALRVYNLHLESYSLSPAQRKALYETVADAEPRRRRRKRQPGPKNNEDYEQRPSEPHPERPLPPQPPVEADLNAWEMIKVMVKKWRIQENQLALLQDHRTAWQGRPSLLCGDLNNPPYTHIYYAARAELQDCYMLKGNGLGHTYGRGLTAMRIDYVMASKHLSTHRYQTLDTEGISDHKAVLVSLRFGFHN